MNQFKLIAAAAILLSTTGCAYHNASPPIAISMVPDDCGNIDILSSYLAQQAAISRRPFETEIDYVRHRSEIRKKIWIMRYICRPV